MAIVYERLFRSTCTDLSGAEGTIRDFASNFHLSFLLQHPAKDIASKPSTYLVKRFFDAIIITIIQP